MKHAAAVGQHREHVSWSALHAAIQENPNRGARLAGTVTASASIAAIPTIETSLAWLSGWKEDTTCTVSDIVSLFLWISDPLYRVAVAGVRRTMEMELASTLLTSIETEWKTRGGRQRGWVRKHLEEDLRGRSAGADPVPDFWERVRCQKRTALLVDFVCVVHGFRAALWWPTHKSVTTLPLTGVSTSAGIININAETSRVLLHADGWQSSAADWVSTTISVATDMTWVAPACSPSAGAQTIAQIQDKLTSVGATKPESGGKAGMWKCYLWQILLNSLAGEDHILHDD